MTAPRLLDDIAAKLSELASTSPAKDIEKNVKALLGGAFGRLDLVTREEFDVQRDMLSNARLKLIELEERVVSLEAELLRTRSGEDNA